MYVKDDMPRHFWITCQHSPTPDNYSQKHTHCHTFFRGCTRRSVLLCVSKSLTFMRECSMLSHSFQRLWKSILQSHIKNKGLRWTGAASGRPRGPVNRKRTPLESKWQSWGALGHGGNCTIPQALCPSRNGARWSFKMAEVMLELKLRPRASLGTARCCCSGWPKVGGR